TMSDAGEKGRNNEGGFGSGGRGRPDDGGAETTPHVPIPESDEALMAECRVETFRAGGPGGQHQNTTESAVRLVHLPTGTRVTARDERSQHRNRAIALDRLRRALEERNREQAPRIGTRVPARERRKRLEAPQRSGRTTKM